MPNTRQSYNGQGGYNTKLSNYYQVRFQSPEASCLLFFKAFSLFFKQSAPFVPQMYGNSLQKQRYAPYASRNYGGGVNANNTLSNYGGATNQSNLPQPLLPPAQQSQQPQSHLSSAFQSASTCFSQVPVPINKSLNSSLNSSSYSDSGKNSTFFSSNQSGCSSPHQSNYSNDSGSMVSTGSSSTINTSGGLGTCSSTSSSSVSPVPQVPPPPQPPSSSSSQPLSAALLSASVDASDQKEMVVLQISNLDSSIEEHKMHQFLMCQLKPITPVISLTIESPSLAKVKVPTAQVSSLACHSLLDAMLIWPSCCLFDSVPNKWLPICIVRRLATSVWWFRTSRILLRRNRPPCVARWPVY